MMETPRVGEFHLINTPWNTGDTLGVREIISPFGSIPCDETKKVCESWSLSFIVQYPLNYSSLFESF